MAIDPIIQKKANDIRTKVYGIEVREDLASGLETMSSQVVDNSEKQRVLEGKQNNLETQFQQVIDETTGKDIVSAPEIIAARGTHPDLSQRLLSTEQQLTENVESAYLKYEQTDFVDLLERYANFDDMQIQKLDNNIVDVTLFNKKRFLKFTFASYAGEYWVQSYVISGEYAPFLQGGFVKRWGEITRTGAWSNATESLSGYTFEVGATFEAEVNVKNDGDGIMLAMNANTNGGMWRVTVDGQSPQDVSVYSNPSTKVKRLLGQYARGTHVVKGSFLGSDPDNPVSQPRGWLNSTTYDTILSGEVFSETTASDVTFSTPSNKDFAINIAPNGSNNFELIPNHGVQTDFLAEPIIMLDGSNIIDFDGMYKNEYKKVSSFLMKQHLYGRNTASGSENLVEIWTNQMVNKKGVLSVDGKIKALKDIEIKNSYVVMGVAKGDLFTKIVSSIGNEYKKAPYGNSTQLSESDFGKSYLFISDINKNVATAFRYNDIRRTLRQNKEGKDNHLMDRAYIQFRDSNVIKIYNRLFNQSNVKAGFTHTYSGDYIFAHIPSAYDIFV